MAAQSPGWHGTTVLCVKRHGKVVIGADGQVTLGPTVIKATAKKTHRLAGGRVLVGFAGATADAFTLLERFEKRLASHNEDLARAAEELSRDWRTDRVLRRLEAMLIVADKRKLLVLSGLGDVLAPEEDIVAIGSGAPYAEAAARALARHAAALSAQQVVEESLRIAADICIYTNHERTMETLDCE